LLLVVPAHAVNATLYEKLNYNFIRDIAPVASFTREPNVMVVNPALPAESVPEFIVYANANPGRINMASSGDQCDSRRPQREGATRGTRRHGAPWLARRLRQLIAEETEKWGKVIRTANIKPE
jgi:hypothetical protein